MTSKLIRLYMPEWNPIDLGIHVHKAGIVLHVKSEVLS